MEFATSYTYEERIIFALRDLYRANGYRQYKMSKIENYDLYADKKDYLVSSRIITFTDTDGSLKALKPDVTLSLVNSLDIKPGATQKMFYSENVYRVTRANSKFEELMQVGLECIGDIDAYSIAEVTALAIKSLQTISESNVLVLSDVDIATNLISATGLNAQDAAEVTDALARKSVADLQVLATSKSIDERIATALINLAQPKADAREELARLAEMGVNTSALSATVDFLEKVGLASNVRIDCSLLNEGDYYNGIVFEGYVEGVPMRVLSGGQYDRLLETMNLPARAIGFAVYTDILEKYLEQEREAAIDTVLLYNESDNPSDVFAAVQARIADGERVIAAKEAPQDVPYKNVVRFGD
jgi:ATP phosphoribosyltransferase regulatory subunit